MEQPKFSGFISKVFDKNDEYSFYYDGKKLNLVFLNESNRRLDYNTQEKAFLLARYSIGGTIGLYRCFCQKNYFGTTATIYPSMIYISEALNSTEVKFNKLLFKGQVVNRLFPPIQKVKYDSIMDYCKSFDGSKIIELKSFADTDITFTTTIDNTTYNCKFGVYLPGSINKDDDNLGELTSYFSITFEDAKHIQEISSLYSIVRKFFQFLAKQQDIYFDEIQVHVQNDKNKFERIGYFFDNTTEHNDIESKFTVIPLLNNLGKLFSRVAENELNYNYIPKDSFESKYITMESYIKVCGAFERNYEIIFTAPPNNDKYKIDTIAFIKEQLNNKLATENLSKEYKKYFYHVIDVLYKDINSVETQYNRCLKRYQSAICDLRTTLFDRYKLSKIDLGKEFSDFRNKDAHGNIIEFSNESACAFIIGLSLIDCMILDEAGFDLDAIKTIINNRY